MHKANIRIWAVGMVVLAIAVFFMVNNNSAGAQQHQADAYRNGQDQFIQLIGEEEFARFNHGHPPLECNASDWEERPLSCSEAWLHRFDIAEIVQPDFQDELPRTSEPKTPGDPTAVPSQ